MAEEKKPKIDLKARLGKGAVGAPTPMPPPAGIPVPAAAPSAAASVPATNHVAPAASSAGLPVPPGVPVGPPPAFKGPAVALDPSNPLAAAVAQQAPSRPAAPVAPPAPQRIEVDELAVQEARKGARKQGLVAGVVIAVVLGAIGYIAGGASETSKGRKLSVEHAKSLSGDVRKSNAQLKTLAEKVEAGRDQLLKEKKFPDTLARDLGGINVDFDGTKLAGVRFSGFSQDTASGLIEFISSVQSTNDRKNALIALLSKLQKPITEQLAAAATQKQNINYVVLVDKDSAGNRFGILSPLVKPIELSAQLPAEFTATNPLNRANVTAPKLANLDKAGYAYVVQKSVDAACPSETAGQIAQLAGQLSRLVSDIRGEKSAPDQPAMEDKPGLLDRGDRLATGLDKVQ